MAHQQQHAECDGSKGVRDLDGGGGGRAGADTKTVWAVPPLATKEVIRLAFKSHVPGTYAGYVHVKTDADNMVLPVEITVLKGGVEIVDRPPEAQP